MAAVKKLQLEIYNPKGEHVKTHHFMYDSEKSHDMILTVGEYKYKLNGDGKMIQSNITVCDAVELKPLKNLQNPQNPT